MVERERRRKNVPEKPKKSVPKVIFGWTFQIIVVIMFAYVLVYFLDRPEQILDSQWIPHCQEGILYF